MTRRQEKDTLVILDFDGTLYRGSCPLVFNGIANADLILMLCLQRLFRPARLAPLLGAGIRLAFFERRTYRAYREGRLSLSEADRRLVAFFEERVLADCGRAELDRAAAAVSRGCYRAAWRCLGGLKDRCDFVAVSKSFTFLLEQVRRRASAYGIDLAYCGKQFGASSGGASSVVIRDDKRERVTALLTAGGYRRAAVIGDTEDDIVMRDAAVDALGASAVVFICLHAKDARVAGAADRRFSSWRQAGKFLETWLNGDAHLEKHAG